MLMKVWRELDRLSDHIETVEPGTDEYDKVQREMNEFVHMENTILERSEFDSKLDKFLKNQALVAGVFTLAGTVLVLTHERAEIITSRAFGWLRFK